MFTGIVEEAGELLSLEEQDRSWRLRVRAPIVSQDVKLGDSIANNGCCLTVVEKSDDVLGFDLLAESLRLTNFQERATGRLINLERSLLPTTRMGGHFVSGHVDDLGEVVLFEPRGKDYYLQVKVSDFALGYLAYKGSIAVDGVSLTVAEVHEDGLSIWLIPHTIEVTNLRELRVGEHVNLEFDLLAKYTERLLQTRGG